MAASLLTTKLYIPPPRPDLVPRPYLIQRLDQSLRPGHRLTLIAAPAGFGKTTLLSAWRASPVSRDYPLAGRRRSPLEGDTGRNTEGHAAPCRDGAGVTSVEARGR